MKHRSEVSAVLPAPPHEAFAVLEDPKSFAVLVAGARRIRRFDPRWPERGTAIHHTVGIPPLLVRDSTEVLEIDRPSLLRLEARIWPLGTLLVELLLSPHPDGSTLVVREEPRDGPLTAPLIRGLVRAALRLRNRQVCRLFRKLLEERA